MSLSLISEDDFVGFLNIEFSTFEEFDDYAEQLEEKIMRDLVGWEMYQDMIDNPAEVKYTNLMNGVEFDTRGIKEMQRGFFYFYFLTDRQTQGTTIGEIELNLQNGNLVSGNLGLKMVRQYNKAVDIYSEVTDYILENLDTYTLYDATETVVKSKINQFSI